VAKRHQPVDTDYILSSKYYEDVRAEMLKASLPRRTEGRGHGQAGRTDGLDRAGVRHLDHSQQAQALGGCHAKGYPLIQNVLQKLISRERIV
jgi:hypothetical protein